jgi:response regulator RpfG family c-di-GMP phosphodiesterase
MVSQFNFILIDDSSLDLFFHGKIIAINGLASSVKPFNSAEDALQFLIDENESLSDSVILLDLQMPGMNGFEFIDKFHLLPESLKSKIQIYMLSSTIDTRDVEKAKSSPYIIDLLAKPLDVHLLRKRLIPSEAE